MGDIISSCIGYIARRFSSTSIQLVLFLVINYCGKSIPDKNSCHSCIRLGQEFFTHNFVFPITIGIKKTSSHDKNYKPDLFRHHDALL